MVAIPKMQFNWRQVLVTFGPGLVVMLANTEVGSVITAAQSGAKWLPVIAAPVPDYPASLYGARVGGTPGA